MESDTWWPVIGFVLLLILSAFFSGSESAYFSLKAADLRRMRERKKTRNSSRVLTLMERPRRLLATILIGNTVVNVAAATTAALFTARFLHRFAFSHNVAIFLEILAVTMTLLIFSEVTPKVFAIKHPERFAEKVSLPLWFVFRFLSPLSLLFIKITHGVSVLFRFKKELPFINEEELKTLIEVGEEKGTLDHAEREMIHSIFEFRETQVKEVMIPRTDMVALSKETPIEDVLKLVKEKGHSRIPVYNETVDSILGILYVKDLLPYMRNNKDVPLLPNLLHKAYYVPESKMIDELLKEFQQERMHMAIVVDEYGGTAGLITLEDVIEEIVGEIRDEYDREPPLIRQVDDQTWLVEGKINIDELNDALDLQLPSEEDYDSLGGFLFLKLGHIPDEKEKVVYGDLELIVEKVHSQRIKEVRLIRRTQSPPRSGDRTNASRL